jgi:hypothetical protein
LAFAKMGDDGVKDREDNPEQECDRQGLEHDE